MPQNGIYHPGISALSDAFKNNKNLQILNLNDNTIGPTGSKTIANILPALQNLKEINFGDCLLKNDGAKYLATGLSNCMKLESLTLGFNEIKKDGALELISALTNKSQLKALVLDGNNFGSEGKDAVRKKMIEIGKLNALGSLDDDDSIDSEDEEDTEEEQYQDDDGEDWEEIVIKEDEKIRFLQNNSHNQSKDDVEIIGNLSLNDKTVAVADFLNKPSADNFLGLGPNVSNLLLSEAEVGGLNCEVGSKYRIMLQESNENHIEKLTEMLMKVGSLNVAIKGEENIQRVLKCTEVLFEELVAQSQRSDCLSIMNNFLLVYLGLIKVSLVCSDLKILYLFVIVE